LATASRSSRFILPRALLLVTLLAASTHPSQAAAPLPAVEIPQRREILARRNAAEDSGDLNTAATIHAELVREALLRARAVHDAWMPRRNASTALFPQSDKVIEWNYHNVAADFFCFQYAIARLTDAPSLPLLSESFTREAALDGPDGLCRPAEVITATPIERSPQERMFGTSEYLKDGLIGLYERTGDPMVLGRMTRLADAMIADSTMPSRFGDLPARDSETNGNVLQAFSRLHFAAGDARYGEMAGRLADAVTQQMFALTGNLPVMDFDYATDSYTDDIVQLRDHGNEAAVGLSEAYAMAVSRRAEPEWAARADRWAAPIARMFEAILTHGVDANGLIVNRISQKTLEPVNLGACDNWGYLLTGAILFTEAAARHGKLPAERLSAILDRVDKTALVVAKTDGLDWEWGHHDGFADSVESALYVASRRRAIRRTLLEWSDDQIAYLYKFQRPDGIVAGNYLDGNFIRTAMLYAEMRSGGYRLDPWSETASVGCAIGADGAIVVAVVAGPGGYTGRLIPPEARWRTNLHLPWDWARINGWPTWVETDDKPVEIKLSPGETAIIKPTRKAGPD
jgi:hypothetical protein